MRITLALLVLTTLTGCVSLHAEVPEEVVRQHIAREEGIEIGAICSHEGRRYSEGAIACMAGERMACDETGRWVHHGEC